MSLESALDVFWVMALSFLNAICRLAAPFALGLGVPR